MYLTIYIGGIYFKIYSDSFISDLLKNHFGDFIVRSDGHDILFEIRSVSRADLNSSPLEQSHKVRLSNCVFPPFLGPGLLTIPFISPAGTENYFNRNNNDDIFDIPLLRSKVVKEKLDIFLDHPEQVALALHKYSISIRDYQEKWASLFYWEPCRNIIKDSEPTELFRRLFVSFFPLFSAMLVHASCFVKTDHAALFLAPDEGGKTTLIRMDHNGIALGDDRILLKKQVNGFSVYGTPWGTIKEPTTTAKLGAIFLLKKAEKFQLTKLSSERVISYLWQEHKYDRFFLTKDLRFSTFEMIVDLCRHVPLYQMEFSKNYVDWDVVDEVMGEGHAGS